MRTRRWSLPVLALALAACGSDGFPDEPIDSAAEPIVVCPGADTRPGIDVSYYQGNIDWAAVKAAGIAFAVTRVNDGSFMDPAAPS